MEACKWAWEHEAGLVDSVWRLGKGQLCGRTPEQLQRSESRASDCGERPLPVWLPWPLLAMRAGRDTGRETRPHGHTWWGHKAMWTCRDSVGRVHRLQGPAGLGDPWTLKA